MAKKKAKSKAKKTGTKKQASKKKTTTKVNRTKPTAKPVAKKKKVGKKTSSRARAKPQAAPTAPPPPPNGSFVWHELMTPDVGRAKDFYSRLFGWRMQDEEMMPGFIYTMMFNKSEGVGGMMAITPEQGDVKPHWMVYVSVKDVDATAQQTEEMGGEIVVPPHDIPVGRWALLQDPTGATFAVYKSFSR